MVGDVPHTSTQIVYESPSPISPEHRAFILNYYPVGQALTVYYRADAPDQAQLEHHADDTLFFVFLMVGAGLILLILANGWLQSLINTQL
jgi:Mg2+/citrate symporter